MKRKQLLIYLVGLLALAGCTVGLVEDTVPPEARMVEVCFARPDLGMPVVLTRAGETPVPESLPAGSTVRIAAYRRGNVGKRRNRWLSLRRRPTSRRPMRWHPTAP